MGFFLLIVSYTGKKIITLFFKEVYLNIYAII